MIDNLVFDLGQVLLSFEPQKYLEKLYDNPAKRERLMKTIFESRTWLDLDQGLIDEAEAYERMAEGLPAYSEEILYVLEHWDEILVPIEPTVRLLHRLKEQGISLYMISNFHRRAYDRVRSRYSFFSLFDGIVISSHVELLKPDPAIFKKLVGTYSLTPETCLFIDDTPANVAAARSIGMKGLVFQDGEALEKELAGMGILKHSV